MKRKLAMAAAFIVAITGAIATKAAPQTSYLTLTNCAPNQVCSNSGTIDCGYHVGDCKGTVVKKTNP